MEIRYMGQDLLNPPTVEGWHTGAEWVDSGTLFEISPDRLLDGCLEMLGDYKLNDETRLMLINHAESTGALPGGTDAFAQQVGQMLQLIVSTQEYQFT